jgi:hypothetical protein
MLTAIANRFIVILLLVSQYIECKRQRKDDGKADRAGVQIRHQNFRLRLNPM